MLLVLMHREMNSALPEMHKIFCMIVQRKTHQAMFNAIKRFLTKNMATPSRETARCVIIKKGRAFGHICTLTFQYYQKGYEVAKIYYGRKVFLTKHASIVQSEEQSRCLISRNRGLLRSDYFPLLAKTDSAAACLLSKCILTQR